MLLRDRLQTEFDEEEETLRKINNSLNELIFKDEKNVIGKLERDKRLNREKLLPSEYNASLREAKQTIEILEKCLNDAIDAMGKQSIEEILNNKNTSIPQDALIEQKDNSEVISEMAPEKISVKFLK